MPVLKDFACLRWFNWNKFSLLKKLNELSPLNDTIDENNFILPRLLSISSIFLSINNSESPDIGAKKILSLLEKYTPENQRFRKIIIIFMKTQGYGVDNCWFSVCGPYLSFRCLKVVIIWGGCFFLSIFLAKINFSF